MLPLLKTVDITIPAKTFLHRRYVSAPMAQPFVRRRRSMPIRSSVMSGPTDGNRHILVRAETPDLDATSNSPTFRFRYEQLDDDLRLRDRKS